MASENETVEGRWKMIVHKSKNCLKCKHLKDCKWFPEGCSQFERVNQTPDKSTNNALAELAERMFNELDGKRLVEPNREDYEKAQRIIKELAKVVHGEASPTPWRKHTDREVMADDDRLWLENVVCQTQSCPKTRYTKAEREEWDIPATANTELIVASVNAVAKCRAIAEEK